MLINRTRQMLALDMLIKRAQGKLKKNFSFVEEDKDLIIRAVEATNEMFASKLSMPFSIARLSCTVSWNTRWLDANKFDKVLMPGSSKTGKNQYRELKRKGVLVK
jgi:hypothetical protein